MRINFQRNAIYLPFIISVVYLCVKVNCDDSNESSNHRRLQNIRGRPRPRLLSKVENSLWDVPEWVKKYVAWHKEQRLSHLHDPNTKFLTVTCHKKYACGGLSDRLRSLP